MTDCETCDGFEFKDCTYHYCCNCGKAVDDCECDHE